MPSSFKGVNLFASGPHRFHVGVQGSAVLTDAALGSPGPNSYPVGVRELDILVTGRLAASTAAALDTLRDAVTAMLIQPPTAGSLIDAAGRAWADMSFITYEESGPIDRGRVFSVAYEARFRRFNLLP